MAGYWPSSFLRVYGPRRSRGPLTRKKRTRPISSHLDRTNLVNKGFIIWLLVKFCLRDTVDSPEQARWLHLACSGSQSQSSIWFILPARGASHIINLNMAVSFYTSYDTVSSFFEIFSQPVLTVCLVHPLFKRQTGDFQAASASQLLYLPNFYESQLGNF